jgi:transposase
MYNVLGCFANHATNEGEATMRNTVNRLLGRCPCCGQRLNGAYSPAQRIVQINNRVERLTAVLGRRPFAQNCEQCSKIVFETERGFVKRYLLVDIV